MTSTTVAHPADLDELTLVRELTTRINNQLASAIDMVTAAAVRADNFGGQGRAGQRRRTASRACQCPSHS